VHLVKVAPTIAAFLGMTAPADAQGSPLVDVHDWLVPVYCYWVWTDLALGSEPGSGFPRQVLRNMSEYLTVLALPDDVENLTY
jgi:hypothetical protein